MSRPPRREVGVLIGWRVFSYSSDWFLLAAASPPLYVGYINTTAGRIVSLTLLKAFSGVTSLPSQAYLLSADVVDGNKVSPS